MKPSEFNPKYRLDAWDGRTFIGWYYCPCCAKQLPVQNVSSGQVGPSGLTMFCYRCGAPDSVWDVVEPLHRSGREEKTP